ncbi:Veg family protein [Schnuerera sp. xch1]|uniref:Veg family protein n=1 Tax=Schnuerera sp. xch1 TaxID=2874283 RepID=UPI00398A0C29
MVTLLEKNNLAKIRKNVEDCIGKKVILKANKGRKKTTVREGILEEAYPSLFVVRIYNQFDSMRRVSYTYSDILTQTVEVTICDDTDRQQIKIS